MTLFPLDPPMPPLPGRDDFPYWDELRAWAKINSDGCTCVKDIYVDACYEHDYHYRHGFTFPTVDFPSHPINEAQANTRFRIVMQWESRFGRFSPISWIRYAGVSVFGRYFYHPDANYPDKS